MTNACDPEFAAAFLTRLHAAVNAHDAAAVAALCSPKIVWRDPAAPELLLGREAVARFHRDTMFPAIPDVRIELVDGPYALLNRPGIAVRARIRGTMTGYLTPPGFAPTGRPVDFETAEFSDFEDGLLIRHTVLLDMLDLARQIGAVPRLNTVAGRMGIWLQHFAARRMRTR